MSTRPKFTPGPWKVSTTYKAAQRGEFDIAPWNDQGRALARTRHTKCYDLGECKANAHLIAAAPDLYAACDMVLVASEDGGDMEDIDWNMLRSALAKARGESTQ